ncbi:DUF4190 domain-containing protein [Thermomonospora umbrina]|uniref:Putative regulator of septum formation n=1 Tax=Thermomonospora umbrina TaxID=111806 RepID=A0A3D9SU73_9ACTN|nr:DUF4190 domain-containing protein [Thermomonospora umbrina]REE99328.1 putative regulator of septum formation [Thermomonospora umbrina]
MTMPPDGDGSPWVNPGDAPPPQSAPPPAAAPVAPAPHPYPYPPGPAMPPPGPPSGRPPNNRLAVVALVTGLVGLGFITVFLAVAAFRQIKQSGERGRGLIVGGLAAAVVWLAIGISVAAATDWDPDAGSDDSGQSAFQLYPKTGQCFDWTGEERDASTRIMRCDRLHDAEVVAVFSLEKGPWPGEGKVSARGLTECEQRVRQRFGTTTPLEHGEIFTLYPRRLGWKIGDRRVHCMIAAAVGDKLDRPLPKGDLGLRTWDELGIGDCFIAPRERATVTVKRTACDDGHTGQVTYRFVMPAGVYPGERTVDRASEKRCDRGAAGLVMKRPPVPLEYWWVGPSEESWTGGDRRVVCYVTADQGDLTRSVIRPR